MKAFAVLLFLSLEVLWACGEPACGQAFSFVPQQTLLAETLGAEIVFQSSCTNLGAIPLTLTFIRTINALPGQWESSMCLDVCYQSTVDTIATTAEYGSSPLEPGEVRDFSLHVYPVISPGTGYIRILVMDRRNASDSLGVLFTATAITSDVGEWPVTQSGLRLEQNYPNPFNGETRIGYRLPSASARPSRSSEAGWRTSWSEGGAGGQVTMKVYDMLGREVATLVDAHQPPGRYELTFNARELPSGVYYCRLQADKLQETRRIVILR